MDFDTLHPISGNRDLSQQFPPFHFSLINPTPLQDSSDPDQVNSESPIAHDSLDRIVLVNPVTQGMVVIEPGGSSSSSNLDSLLQDLLSKGGQLPASKSSIESLPGVEIGGDEKNSECVVCLEEWGLAGFAKEMPCKHRFHQKCIEKWLGIHGSCPVCRYKLPTENGDDLNKKVSNGQRREIWLSFSFGSNGNRGNAETTEQPIASTSASLDDEMES
ncbi:unnamed protein product [Cuscuta epithymum]|uniref:RING-type E3 ubiquitin transferase n=1 Tax=Cuscuta epithymum TaxID=186058 RepID=A0AAV0CY02_9ASTE|nr:unnamed protein product [Cuscuta epithymum]